MKNSGERERKEGWKMEEGEVEEGKRQVRRRESDGGTYNRGERHERWRRKKRRRRKEIE